MPDFVYLNRDIEGKFISFQHQNSFDGEHLQFKGAQDASLSTEVMRM